MATSCFINDLTSVFWQLLSASFWSICSSMYVVGFWEGGVFFITSFYTRLVYFFSIHTKTHARLYIFSTQFVFKSFFFFLKFLLRWKIPNLKPKILRCFLWLFCQEYLFFKLHNLRRIGNYLFFQTQFGWFFISYFLTQIEKKISSRG